MKFVELNILSSLPLTKYMSVSSNAANERSKMIIQQLVIQENGGEVEDREAEIGSGRNYSC